MKNETTSKSNILWAILFVSDKPVFYDDIRNKLEIPTDGIISAIEELKESLKDTPLMLLETENSLKLVTKPEYAHYIRKFLSSRPQRLSDAALETLAIIISKQPCTRQEIEKIREVDCEKTLETLLSAGLIKQIGSIKHPGSPILYSITEECLFKFGMKSYEELSNLLNLR